MERDEQRRDGQEEGDRPSDTERLVGETPASEALTSAPRVQPPERESRGASVPPPDGGAGERGAARTTGEDAEREAELGHS